MVKRVANGGRNLDQFREGRRRWFRVEADRDYAGAGRRSGEGIKLTAVGAVAGVDAAAEPAIREEPEVIAFCVVPGGGASGAAGEGGAVGEVDHLLEFGEVKGHMNYSSQCGHLSPQGCAVVPGYQG